MSSALTSALTSGNGFKFNRTITKVHKRPQTKLYSKILQEEDAEDEEIQANGMESIELDFLGVETSSTSSSEKELDLTAELSRPINLKKSPYFMSNNFSDNSKENVVEKNLEKDDTLQNLSLKYGCKISELKRKNNIINDSEFYGLRTIKIPVKKFSYAEEKLMKELETKTMMEAQLPCSGSSLQDQNRSRFLCTSPRKLRIGDSLFGENRQEAAATFLQQMDNDLETMRLSMNSRKETLEEVTQVLTCKSIRPLGTQHSTTNKNYFFKASRIIILLIIIVLVIFPVLLILWIKLGRSKP